MGNWPNRQSRALSCVRDILGALRVQRSTILISLFAFAALSVPAATREVYRVLAEDMNFSQTALGVVTLLLASAAIWYIGRDLSWRLQPEVMASRGVKGFLLRWLPFFCAALVPLGAAWGIYLAAEDLDRIVDLPAIVPRADPDHARDFPSQMLDTQWQLAELLAGMRQVSRSLHSAAMFFLLATLTMGALSLHPSFACKEPPERSLLGTFMRSLVILACTGIVAIFSIYLIDLPRHLGTIAVFALFLITLTVFVGNLVYVEERFGLPVILTALLAALGFSVLDINDNHEVQPVESALKSSDGRNKKVARDEFITWLQARRDAAEYMPGPYPVFIVSAAGGGLYAATYVAKFLARIQDHCPHFAQHIFAISGVSGGSVGGAVFASVAAQELPQQVEKPTCRDFGFEPGKVERKVDEILRKDYLSPIAAATLFPDFVQRFLPFTVRDFDRGQVLDAAFEAAWRELYPSKNIRNPLEAPLQDLWDPNGVMPALLLNATQVGTGSRMVMAPFFPSPTALNMIKLEWLQGHIQANRTAPSRDLKLSTSMGISARFPWIMPAATVRGWRDKAGKTERSMIRLVDGGYFENSGSDTAGDLIRLISGVGPQEGRDFKVYLLVLTGYENNLFNPDFDDQTALGEILSPIRTLLSTRQARADLTMMRTFDYLCPDLDNCRLKPDHRGRDQTRSEWGNKALWIFATMNLRDFELPLSWHLSRYSRRFIDLHAGRPSDCGNAFNAEIPLWTDLQRSKRGGPRMLGAINATNCAASVVCGRLADRKLNWVSASENQMENYCTDWPEKPVTPLLPATTSPPLMIAYRQQWPDKLTVGTFRRLDAVRWIEVVQDSNQPPLTHHFVHKNATPEQILLFDQSRGMWVRLELSEKRIYWSSNQQQTWNHIYDVTDVFQ
jgi:hypothetical protein